MKEKINTAAKILIPGYGIASLITETIIGSSKKSQSIIDNGNEIEIEKEIKRRTAETKILEMEAKISQEVAIAKRIENAIDVEIEEYYEGSGSGKIGASKDEKGINLGVSGEGRKIAKRIYKFKGIRNTND